MLIISKTLSGSQANGYYQEDYSNPENSYHDVAVLTGRWFGQLAAEMGLTGEVQAGTVRAPCLCAGSTYR